MNWLNPNISWTDNVRLVDAPSPVRAKLLKLIGQDWGFPPSVRDLMDAMGFRSPNAIREHLIALRDAGLVVWEPRKDRTLRTTLRRVM